MGKQAQRPSIIIIDDDIDEAEAIEELMKFNGMDVIAVGHNGKDAVELYEKYKPDVVLLDLMMPEYDGYYAIEEITKLDSNAKVILISGAKDSRTDEIAKYGIVQYIVNKPFDTDNLIKKILN